MLTSNDGKINVLISEIIAIVTKIFVFVSGLRFTGADDAKVIKDLKRLESICVSYNILPNGYAEDQSVTPSQWTRTKSILYSSLMTVNIVHLIVLSLFDLPQDLSLILGDFLYGKPSRRYFWLNLMLLSIFGEVLRFYWIYLYKTGKPTLFHMRKFVGEKGFKFETLSMNHFYHQKYCLTVSNLVNFWIRINVITCIGIGPGLIIIAQSVSQLPKTPQQFIFTYFWLLIHYFGIVFTLINMQLTGAIITVELAYYYFRAAHVTQTSKNFINEKMFLTNDDFLIHYEKTIQEIIAFLNETEYRNIKVRNWLIYLYLGLSFSADFGFYSAGIVHIDHGSLDYIILFIATLNILSIGICSYVNGVLLTKMHSCGKNNMKVARYLPSDVKSLIKFADLQSRLSRTDIMFTIGFILDMTTYVFVMV